MGPYTLTALVFFRLLPTALAIVGGTRVADLSTYPYTASIQTTSFKCGAVLVAAQTVLTVPECVANFKASQLKVRVGSLNRAGGGNLVSVSTIEIHTSHNETTNDIALLYLSSIPGLVSYGIVKPATLPLPGIAPVVGSTVTSLGWGVTKQGSGSHPVHLMQVDDIVTAQATCQSDYPDLTIGAGSFCDGVSGGGKGTCTGDFGGPVVQNGVVVGLIGSNYEGCAQSGYPDVNTNLADYIVWITERLL